MYKVEITGVDTSKLATLSNDEQVRLLKLVAEKNCQVSREALIKGNLKLVLSVLKKFHNRKESMDDLFQVGCIGLIKSVDNFNLKYEVRFSTYAVPMIIGEIRRHLRDSGSIRVSRSYKDIAYKTINIKENFWKEKHREPTINEIAQILEVDSLDVVLALEAIQDTVSMSTPIYENGGDVIELEDQFGTDDYITNTWEKEKMLKDAFLKLDSREKQIIIDRYFNEKTQMEIAEELDISQAQVSRIEKNALKLMKDAVK